MFWNIKDTAPSPLANGEVKSGIIEVYILMLWNIKDTAPSPLANGDVKSGIIEVYIDIVK